MPKVPIGAVIAKIDKEEAEEVGLTDRFVFGVLKNAMAATKVIAVDTLKEKGERGGKDRIRVADWSTRLQAISMYIDMIGASREAAGRIAKTDMIEVSPAQRPSLATGNKPRIPQVMENGHTIEEGMIVMPAVPRKTLRDIIMMQEQEIEDRENGN